MRGFFVLHIAILALLIDCAPLCAQTNGNDSILHIDGVEVTAVRNTDTRSLSPQFTLHSSDFLRLNITDMTSALRRLPGVTLRDYGGAGGMKTVSVRGLGSHHTALAIDGLLLPEGHTGQVNFQHYMLSEISSLTMHIAGDDDIFQPARNLSSASLLSITTMPSHTGLSASASVGSWGRCETTFHGGVKAKRWSLGANGGYTRSDNDYPFTVHNGVDTHRENRTNSRLRQGFSNLSASWQIAPDATLRTMLRLSDTDSELPGIVRLYTNKNDETLRDRDAQAHSLLTMRIAPKWWLKSALRWQWSKQVYHNGIPSGGITSERYTNREYYATAAVLFKPLSVLDLDYSVDAFHSNMTTTLQANPHPHRNALLQSLSAKWHFWRVTLIGQLLNSNIDTEHHLSPMVSASYQLLPKRDFFLRASVKDIFRMPTMTELYYFHLGRQQLSPEKALQTNVGISGNGSLSVFDYQFTADVYINNVRDKIVCIPFNMFVSRYVNLSRVLGRGADVSSVLSLRMSGRQSLSLSGNYSYQRIGMRDVVERFRDYQIAYTPLHSGSASLSWLNPWVNASLSLVGASSQFTNNEHNGSPLHGYTELGAMVYRSFTLARHVAADVSLSVQNILAAEYSLVANYPMPGRSFLLTMKIKTK